MELDPGAVVLELEGGAPAVNPERLHEVAHGLGEHGEERDEDADGDGEEPRLALRQGDPCDDGGVGEEVKRAPYGGRGDPGGRGDRLGEEAFLETQAHLPVNDPLEEVTLVRGGPGEKAPEGLALSLP